MSESLQSPISLHVVDLGAVGEAWRSRALDRLVQGAPRGRVAALLSGPLGGVVIDGKRPADLALGAVPGSARRALFDAMCEDLAVASLYDTQPAALNAAMAALARMSTRHELTLAQLLRSGLPPYPNMADFAADGPVAQAWRIDPGALEQARKTLGRPDRRTNDLPESRITHLDPELLQDVLDALAPMLDALSRPGLSLVAIGITKTSGPESAK